MLNSRPAARKIASFSNFDIIVESFAVMAQRLRVQSNALVFHVDQYGDQWALHVIADLSATSSRSISGRRTSADLPGYIRIFACVFGNAFHRYVAHVALIITPFTDQVAGRYRAVSQIQLRRDNRGHAAFPVRSSNDRASCRTACRGRSMPCHLSNVTSYFRLWPTFSISVVFEDRSKFFQHGHCFGVASSGQTT